MSPERNRPQIDKSVLERLIWHGNKRYFFDESHLISLQAWKEDQMIDAYQESHKDIILDSAQWRKDFKELFTDEDLNQDLTIGEYKGIIYVFVNRTINWLRKYSGQIPASWIDPITHLPLTIEDFDIALENKIILSQSIDTLRQVALAHPIPSVRESAEKYFTWYDSLMM